VAEDTAAQQNYAVIRSAANGVSTVMRPFLPILLTAVLGLASLPAAAQSGDRSPYDSNRDCLDRRAPSDQCVIEDGPPPQYRHVRRPVVVQPPPPPPPAPVRPQESLLRR
jgi:hypothetical protein